MKISAPAAQDCTMGENFHKALQLFLQPTQLSNIFGGSRKCSPWPKLFRQGKSPSPRTCYRLSGSILHVFPLQRPREVSRERTVLQRRDMESVAEYFENTFNLQVANGSLMKKRKRKIKFCAKCKLHHLLERRYKEKLHNYAKHCYPRDDHGGGRDHTYRRSNKYERVTTTATIATTTTIATTNKTQS